MFSRALTAAAIAVGIFLAPAVNAVCSRTYVVVPGDTCDAIAAAQGASTYQILLNNPTVNSACTNLGVGQVLCLATEGQDCTTLHTVAEGDTCAGILTDADISLDILRGNNANVDSGCGNIYPGLVLCTASTLIYVPPQ